MERTAILVSSIDKYEACWEPFCYGLKKYWPQHFQPVYFITNQKTSPYGQSIKVGPDHGWADNLRLALEHITEEYILYAQEDYWINQPVNDLVIHEYVNVLQSGQADYIRLYPAPPPKLAFSGDTRLGILEKDAEYRTSLQMALWRKSILLALLKSGETPWQFEVQGSRRSGVYAHRFLCVQKKAYGVNYVFTAVVNGEWSPLAFQYAHDEGIPVNFDALPRKPLLKQIKDMVFGKLYGYSRQVHRILRG
jgi:hypothetical protein